MKNIALSYAGEVLFIFALVCIATFCINIIVGCAEIQQPPHTQVCMIDGKQVYAEDCSMVAVFDFAHGGFAQSYTRQ